MPAKKFMLFEDNEDGTTTLTINMAGEEELTFVIPFGLEEFGNMIPQSTMDETAALTIANVIPIPNDVTGGF